MYSRNQGCGQSRRGYGGAEGYDAVSDEEYEMYKYNLPPRYDGSRFRRNSRRGSIEAAEPVVESPPCEIEPLPETPPEEPTCQVVPCEPQVPQPCETEGGVLSRLPIGIGYEELLIIALILAIAQGDDYGDALLLLAVLLTQR